MSTWTAYRCDYCGEESNTTPAPVALPDGWQVATNVDEFGDVHACANCDLNSVLRDVVGRGEK